MIMATNEPRDILTTNTKTTYSFNEAIEYMKWKDKQPTRETIRWVDVRTGRDVVIGYNN